MSNITVNAAEIEQGEMSMVAVTNQEASILSSDYPWGYYMVIGTGVRFRESPSLSGNIIATLTKGEYLYFERAAGPLTDADGYTWMHCERYSTGEIGYVAVKYIANVPAPPDAP